MMGTDKHVINKLSVFPMRFPVASLAEPSGMEYYLQHKFYQLYSAFVS